MATPAKKQMYRLQYEDNTYQIVDLTDKEYNELASAMVSEKYAIKFKEYILRLRDIRTVVYLPPPQEPTDAEKAEMLNKAEKQIEEWGMADPDVLSWLETHGVKLAEEV